MRSPRHGTMVVVRRNELLLFNETSEAVAVIHADASGEGRAAPPDYYKRTELGFVWL